MYTIVLSTLTGVLFAGSALGSKATPQMRKAGHNETPAERAAATVDNTRFARYTLTVLAGIIVLLAIFRVVIHSVRYIRTLTCLNNDTQRYFRTPNLAYGAVKQHLLYAPLFRRRHLRELHFGWFHMGYVPSRFQSLFLTAVIIMNVTLSVAGIEWNGTRAAALSHLRNRTGTLSVINMIPLVVLAGRNNPLISLLSISFDNFNLVHRWFGRIVVLQALAHSVAEVINVVEQGKQRSWSIGTA